MPYRAKIEYVRLQTKNEFLTNYLQQHKCTKKKKVKFNYEIGDQRLCKTAFIALAGLDTNSLAYLENKVKSQSVRLLIYMNYNYCVLFAY